MLKTNSSSKTPESSPSEISFSISSPGKVILHGEHSVVYKKLAIAASLGLRTKATFREICNSSEIHIHLLPLNFSYVLNLEDLQKKFLFDHPTYNWETPESIDHHELLKRVDAYVSIIPLILNTQQTLSLRSIIYLFAAIFGCVQIPIEPFVLSVDSELSLGSGCGSSASFAVTLTAVFIQYVRLKAAKATNVFKEGCKQTNLFVEDLTRFDANLLEIISKWAYSAEKITHGLPSGIDNTICTYGSTLTFRKTEGHTLLNYGGFQLLLVNTHVKRNTKLLVEKAATLKKNYPKIVEAILESMEEVSISAVNLLAKLNAAENEEVMKECYAKLGEITDINQNLLRSLGVSHPTLDKICLICKNYGLCGKLTGAGGGGYAIAMVPPYFTETCAIIEELKREGFDATLTSLGGDGVRID